MNELAPKVLLPDSVIDRHVEVVSSLAPFVRAQVEDLIPINKIWQPSDLLPDSQSPTFLDEIRDLREKAARIPTFVLVSLIGNLVTEEGLPMYESGLNRVEGVKDKTGRDDLPWARWIRDWTAQEARHGRGLNLWLYLSGRANMREVDETIQWFISNGFDPEITNDNDPYTMLAYTSFQERATAKAHRNVAKIAKEYGDKRLAKLCGKIAADELVHEMFYIGAFGEVFDLDPDGAMLAMSYMFERGMIMPGGLMGEIGENPENIRRSPLFVDYSDVTQAAGIFTMRHYAEIFDYLMRKWKVVSRRVSGDAQEAQDKLGKQSERLHTFAEVADWKVKRRSPIVFSWLPGATAQERTIDIKNVLSETPLDAPQKRKIL